MKRTIYLLALPLLLLLPACGGSQDEHLAPSQHDEASSPEAPAVAKARAEGGVQIVEVEIGTMGFVPKQITLKAGVPVRLVFTRTVEGTCAEQVRIPDFGIEGVALPMHEPIAVAFTPDASGAFTFVCGMNMQTGSLIVES